LEPPHQAFKVYLTLAWTQSKILGKAKRSGSTFYWNPPHQAFKVYWLLAWN
jgi:hypothetical protein